MDRFGIGPAVESVVARVDVQSLHGDLHSLLDLDDSISSIGTDGQM